MGKSKIHPDEFKDPSIRDDLERYLNGRQSKKATLALLANCLYVAMLDGATHSPARAKEATRALMLLTEGDHPSESKTSGR